MILNNSSNRNAVINYLENISEDQLIDDVIIPLYRSFGYSTLYRNSHGLGEHGKDILFYKYNAVLCDMEYIAVQAKAENVTSRNVVDFTNQLIRAITTPATGNSAGTTVIPNYAVFFNSKKISNDARFEFPYLVCCQGNIKIITQDNVAEIIMNMSEENIPNDLKGQLDVSTETADKSIDWRIQNTLFKNNSLEVQALFDNVIEITKTQMSVSTKEMIVDYIFKTWEEDSSWDGTVKPMCWLSKNFDLIQDKQFPKLKKVLCEYTSSTYSYAARHYTEIVFNSITKEQYKKMYIEWIDVMLNDVYTFIKKNKPPLVTKFLTWTENSTENSDLENQLREEILNLDKLKFPLDDDIPDPFKGFFEIQKKLPKHTPSAEEHTPLKDKS